MNVPAQFKKVGVLVNNNRLVTALKQMSGTNMPAVEIASIAAVDTMHHLDKIARRGLQHKIAKKPRPCATLATRPCATR